MFLRRDEFRIFIFFVEFAQSGEMLRLRRNEKES